MNDSELLIYLIRHGESEINLAPEFIGGRSNWAELTQEGVVQAKLLGNWFNHNGIEFNAVYSSPAIRAQQTARYFCETVNFSLNGIELDRLIETITYGE